MSISPRDVAIVRLDNIGDAILTTGFLAALRAAWPMCRIDVWCTSVVAPLFSRCPYVNTVLALPAIPPQRSSSQEAREHLEAFSRMVRDRFDLLINPRCAPDAYGAALYAAGSEIPSRLAFRQRDLVQGFDPNGAYTSLVDPPAVREPAAFVARHLLAALGLPAQMPPPKLVVGRRAAQRASSLGEGKLVMLGIGASLPYKIWPPENFATVANALAGRGYRIVLVGSEGERELARRLIANTSSAVVDLVGHTSLEETAAIAERACLFIGNDSAPKHLAAVVGTPVIDVGWLADDTPGFPYDHTFEAVGARSIRIAPAAAFTAAETLAGSAIRSIAPDRILAAVDSILI